MIRAVRHFLWYLDHHSAGGRYPHRPPGLVRPQARDARGKSVPGPPSRRSASDEPSAPSGRGP
jgi:hypothetical protein